jgi:acyl carrier protein
MSELETELKTLIIESLNLEDVTVDDIDSGAPLFGDGLGLDSIDALELGVAIRRRYQVKLDAETEAVREHFSSVSALARFVAAEGGTAA